PVLYISSTPLICSPFPYTTLFRSLTKLFQRLLCRSRFLQVPPRGAIKSRYLLMIEQMPNKQASPKTFWSQQYGKFPYPNLAPPNMSRQAIPLQHRLYLKMEGIQSKLLGFEVL